MEKNSIKIPSKYLIIISLLGWFALISQFWLILQNRQTSVYETIIRYFSFFTILTNIIVAFCASFLLLRPNTKWGRFFSKPATLTAITVYIVIVGIVYNAILRFLWDPEGLQYITDELLHTVIPILFLLLWLLYVHKSAVKYQNALSWLLYPLIYLGWTVIHGEISGYYPYPFLNVTEQGYSGFLINCSGLFVAFLGLSLFLITVGKYTGRQKPETI